MVVEMHNLLEKLGTEIDHAESKGNPGKLRFLTDAKKILEIFTNQTGTETVLGIFFEELNSYIPIDEKSFEGMFNLQFLEIIYPFGFSNGLAYLPPKLKWIAWDGCLLKCLPSNFKAECLVKLKMKHSKLEKLWEGTQQLGSLKTIEMSGSEYLKEIPDLSKAINLVKVDFSRCRKLESFPSPLNSESLEYLNLTRCPRLKNFPEIKMVNLQHGIEIGVDDCLWNKNFLGLDYLDCLRRCYPIKFLPEHLVTLVVNGNTLGKLWEGIQSLGRLKEMDLSQSENLKEIPDLSKATSLECLKLSSCKNLVTLPFTIGNLQKLEKLEMEKCTRLKVLPDDVNLSSLKTLNLSGCSSLNSFPRISDSIEELHLDHTTFEKVPCCIEKLPRLVELSMRGCSKLTSFPQLSPSIETLYLDDTAIEKVPCCIGMFHRLTNLSMSGCSSLKNISPKILRLTNLKQVDFRNCGGVITGLGDAREIIIQSSLKWTMILPGGQVPTYFNHRAFGNSLTVTLPQSPLSHQFLRFNVCAVVEPLGKFSSRLYLHFRYDCVLYRHEVHGDWLTARKNHHMVLFSFKFQPTGLPSKLDSNDVEFKFVDWGRWPIKEVGIRLLNVSPSLDGSDGRSYETECNNQAGEKCEVVESVSSNKQIQMISCQDNLNLPCDHIVTDTGLISPNLWIDSMITEQQDAQLPIARTSDPESNLSWQSVIALSSPYTLSSPNASTSASPSIFSCWGGLLKKKKKKIL